MDHATQVGLLRRVFALLDGKRTDLAAEPYVNDVSTYTCARQAVREQAMLFRQQPLFLGLSGDAASPGAYFVHEDTGVPILVVRSRAGALHAFLALCRHRGAQLASGAGTGSGRFTCPYHGWTYDDAGRLTAQPCREGFAGLPTAALGLTPLPIVEQDGMIFARPSPGAPIDVDAHLGGAQHELRPLGLQSYVPFARHAITRAMNWKLAIDTFLEAYHVPHLHERTLGPTILGSPAVWDPFGRGGRMIAVRRSIADERARPETEWNLFQHSVVLYQLFPNTMLIYQIDHVETVQAYPSAAGPDSAAIVFALYTPSAVTAERARRHFQKAFDLLLRVSEDEDFRIGEQMQRGFHAAGQDTVIYGRNEPGVAHFHRMIKAALADDS